MEKTRDTLLEAVVNPLLDGRHQSKTGINYSIQQATERRVVTTDHQGLGASQDWLTELLVLFTTPPKGLR